MERTSKQVVESLLERLASGRWNEPDYLLADMADDAEWWVSGSLPISGVMDRQKMAETFGSAGQMSEVGLTITPRSWVVDGDHVALEAEGFMPLRDGREYRNQYTSRSGWRTARSSPCANTWTRITRRRCLAERCDMIGVAAERHERRG